MSPVGGNAQELLPSLAGFKLEEARIKSFVLQEIGSPEKQKIAIDRLRAIHQLSKLIHFVVLVVVLILVLEPLRPWSR